MAWKLLANQGHGLKPLAERSSPEQLKAIAKDLLCDIAEPAAVEFRIYDNHNHLQFVSRPKTSWRMRWKRPRVTEFLDDLELASITA